MSYRLDKPFTAEEKDNFIFKYNQDCFHEGYHCRIEETDKALFALEDNEIMKDGEPIINPDWEEEETARRKAEFEQQFITTSKGNYRLIPRGYANAQQSIDTVNNIVNAMGELTETIANMVIFYDTPDFSKEEECTEEWLIQHQHHPLPMTIEEWTQFYIEFTTLYADKQYKASLLTS